MKPLINIKIEGTEQLLADFRKYRKEAEKAVERGVDRTAIAVANDAKMRLEGGLGGDRRIETDRLRASVHAESKRIKYMGNEPLNESIGEMEAITGTPVEYGGFIEFGTKYISAMSYLGFAAVRQDTKLRERVIEELNEVAKG